MYPNHGVCINEVRAKKSKALGMFQFIVGPALVTVLQQTITILYYISFVAGPRPGQTYLII